MNCKPGDLAVFVRSSAGNEGKFVTCIRLAAYAELARCNFVCTEPVWVTDRVVPTMLGNRVAFARDSSLRPIRPQSDDEADLLLAPLPQQDKVPA